MRDISKLNTLVTGGAGFMGSDFIRQMLSSDFYKGHLVNLDALTYCGNLENLQGIENLSNYRFVKGSIGDTELVESLINTYEIDIIINFAAESHVDRSIVSAEAFYETNVFGTLKLLEVLKNYKNIHFHHISTDEVYGDTTIDKPFTEDSCYLPNSPYAASKASSDHLVRAFGKTFDISTCITHAVNNYGPFQFPEKLIPLTILRLLEEKDIPIYGQGLQLRDWLYVEDHTKAVIQALKYGKAQQVYNFSARQRVTNIALVKNLIKIFCEEKKVAETKCLSLIKYVKDRPGHDFCYAVDPQKAEKDLAWKAEINLEKGLKKTLLWYLKNDQWISHVKTGEYMSWVKQYYNPIGV